LVLYEVDRVQINAQNSLESSRNMAKRIENAKRRAKQAQVEEEENNATFYEDASVLQEEISRSQEFVDSNKKTIATVIGIMVAVVALFFAFKFYMGGQETAAQEELFPAVFYFEKDSLDKALNGDGNSTSGLLAVMDEYGSTDAGNLASFYAGVSYLKKGEFDKAIEYLEDFGTDDFLWQARAYVLTGDAYMEKETYGEAVSYYKKGANYDENEQFTPIYMEKLALAQELNGSTEDAKNTLMSTLEKYPNYNNINEVKRNIGRLEK
jgi:predicted negative regulator of RcsB-dependent stress response